MDNQHLYGNTSPLPRNEIFGHHAENFLFLELFKGKLLLWDKT